MRSIYVVVGHLALVVGIVGIFVPLLPTTPFLLLASWAYSRGSERFHRWLLAHPRLGAPILDWQEHGVIRPAVKVIATAVVVGSLTWAFFVKAMPWMAKGVAAAAGFAVIVFILSRPSRRGTELREENRTVESSRRGDGDR